MSHDTNDELPGTAMPSNPSADPALRIGPYRLLQRLGEGGMGEVWLAEQQAPVRRKVAVKVIKQGMDTQEVVARFEAERQALALMDHPAIATIYEAGATEQGRPYFVMEYVPGVPITQHCDTHRLATRERLELFLQVCDGVQHAHQKAILHRDLKPTNVLVSVQAGRAVPKIIDFGVAKATAQRLTERTLFTELGVLIGTPEYMSPEQADPTGQDIDTRTDVYALGVILYQLLVGALPFDSKRLREGGYDSIRRILREEEPVRPSTRISELGEKASTESARRRQVDVPTLLRQLRGDLDWITIKALEKDRTRRYGSPLELAEDIRRHLRNEPVLAGPPRWAYRAGKFIRRHRFGVAAASVVAAALVVGLVGTAVGFVRARRAEAAAKIQAETSERVSKFLADLLGSVDPQRMGRALASDLRAQVEAATGAGAAFDDVLAGVNLTDTARGTLDREILSRGSETVDEEFGKEPLIAARMRHTIGQAYYALGMYGQAEKAILAALEDFRRTLGEDAEATIECMDDLAETYERQGRYAEAARVEESAVERSRRVLGEDHPQTLDASRSLAVIYSQMGRDEQAERLLREAVERSRNALGEDDPQILWTVYLLGQTVQRRGRFAEARDLFEKTLERQRRVIGEDRQETLWTMNNLGEVYASEGRFADAERLHRAALEGRMRVLGEDHPDTLWSKQGLGHVYGKQGRLAEAESLLREVVGERRRILGDDHWETLVALSYLGGLLNGERRYAESERLLAETFETCRRVLGPEHRTTLKIADSLAVAYEGLGRHEEAERLLRDTLEADGRLLGEENPQTLMASLDLGVPLARRQQYQEAEDLYTRGLETSRRVLGPQNPITQSFLYNLGVLEALRGRGPQAIDWLQKAVDAGYCGVEQILGDSDLQSIRGAPEFDALLDAVRKNRQAS